MLLILHVELRFWSIPMIYNAVPVIRTPRFKTKPFIWSCILLLIAIANSSSTRSNSVEASMALCKSKKARIVLIRTPGQKKDRNRPRSEDQEPISRIWRKIRSRPRIKTRIHHHEKHRYPEDDDERWIWSSGERQRPWILIRFSLRFHEEENLQVFWGKICRSVCLGN